MTRDRGRAHTPKPVARHRTLDHNQYYVKNIKSVAVTVTVVSRNLVLESLHFLTRYRDRLQYECKKTRQADTKSNFVSAWRQSSAVPVSSVGPCSGAAL